MGLNKRLIDQAGGAAGVTNTDNFDIVTYTGNGSTQSISSLDFQPDFIWIKNRSTSSNHILQNTVSGINHPQYSDATYLSYADSVFGHVNSVQSNGFEVDEGNSGEANANKSNSNYVAWCWKGGGTAVSNTDGSITSSVSANQDAGFSIVKYTGGGTSNYTVGHGLSSAPELIIVKNRDQTDGWLAWTTVIDGTSDYLFLNSTGAKGNSGQSLPTSTVVEVQSDGGGESNTLNEDYIMYCFHSVDGYQKIGSYTGNASSINTISVGFAPRFVMFKRTDSSGGWRMFDSTRGTDKSIQAQDSGAEYDDTQNYVDFTSDGFEFNRTVTQTNADLNSTSGTYIYLAIA